MVAKLSPKIQLQECQTAKDMVCPISIIFNVKGRTFLEKQ